MKLAVTVGDSFAQLMADFFQRVNSRSTHVKKLELDEAEAKKWVYEEKLEDGVNGKTSLTIQYPGNDPPKDASCQAPDMERLGKWTPFAAK
eukprot:scaffold15497_cov117-Cylindrotheca_fusiformis.AAC.1